jgi:hypothetical protein
MIRKLDRWKQIFSRDSSLQSQISIIYYIYIEMKIDQMIHSPSISQNTMCGGHYRIRA